MKKRTIIYFLYKKHTKGSPFILTLSQLAKHNLRLKRKAIKAYASGLTPFLGLWMDTNFVEKKREIHYGQESQINRVVAIPKQDAGCVGYNDPHTEWIDEMPLIGSMHAIAAHPNPFPIVLNKLRSSPSKEQLLNPEDKIELTYNTFYEMYLWGKKDCHPVTGEPLDTE